MDNEESQIRQEPLQPLEMRILRLADLLSEGDADLDRDGLCGELESAGIDPAAATARFHAAALRLGKDLRAQGKSVSLSLQQAIAQTSRT